MKPVAAALSATPCAFLIAKMKAAKKFVKPHLLFLIFFAMIVKKLPSSRLWKKLVLSDQSTSARGYVSTVSRMELMGREGEVLTELRPAGSVLLDGSPVDVVSEGAFIRKGERVRVVSVNGSRVVVRKIDIV